VTGVNSRAAVVTTTEWQFTQQPSGSCHNNRVTAVTITEWQLSHLSDRCHNNRVAVYTTTEWQVSQQPSGSLQNNRVAVVTKTEWFSYLISKAANVRSICNTEPLSVPPMLDPSQMVLPFRALWPQFCCHSQHYMHFGYWCILQIYWLFLFLHSNVRWWFVEPQNAALMTNTCIKELCLTTMFRLY
jgi:hypothetical protein